MRRPTRAMICALVAATLMAEATGCASVRVWEIRPEPVAEAVRNVTGQKPFGLAEGHRSPATGTLAPSTPSSDLTLAEQLFTEARRAETLDPQKSQRLYRECMARAVLVMSEPRIGAPEADEPPEFLESQGLYNRALARFLRLTGGHVIRPGESWRAELARQGVTITSVRDEQLWAPERFNELRFPADYVVRGMDHYYGSDGLGVPLMAIRKPSEAELERRQGADRFFPYWEVYPVTAVLRFENGPRDGASSVLELYDTFEADRVGLGGRAVPLAADLTTPTAYHFARGRLGRYEKISLFEPQKLTREAGLHMLHPYERGKIPVVMIHGLGSSPKAWGKVVNELRGDPQLRANYQFWMYMYPTGNPFLLSAVELRRTLSEARDAVDPDHTDPAYDRMVLVGHSMGGLLARLAITQSGDALWRLNSSRPFESLVANPEDRALLARVFFFEPLSFVKRVVFIATPHRGSKLASNFIGRLGDSIIRLPGPLEKTHGALVAQNAPDFFTDRFRSGLPSSIDGLEFNNPNLMAIDRLAPAAWVSAHTILGKVGRGPLESSSDGVVPYSSSHIDWAISERVVPQNHFCQDHPETMEELGRILRVHLGFPGASSQSRTDAPYRIGR
jgi:pimeloyl-ACP methyl ester carboxylesterase